MTAPILKGSTWERLWKFTEMSESGSLGYDAPSRGPSDSPQSLCSDDFLDLLEESEHPRNAAASTSSGEAACPHPGYLSGMCIRCGADKPQADETDGSFLPFKYVHQSLELSKEEAQRLSKMRTAEAESRGKLQLVLDLDHTLLHSAPLDFAAALPYIREWMAAEIEAEEEDPRRKHTLYEVPASGCLTKLRPGVFGFLQSMSHLYEMHIYTMGEESYAAEMAKLLDPEGVFFHRKVISREHSSTPMTKNLDIVIGADHSTVIVDDTWQVWTHHTGNLLSATKYVFFPLVPGEAAAAPRAWLDALADECPSTNEMYKMQMALERVHTAYFAAPPQKRDVRDLLKSLFTRKRIRPSRDG